MAQIPQELPAFIPDTVEEWRKWLHHDTDNVPLAQRRVMGAVPAILDFSIGLHSEAQRLEQERDYWKGAAGRYFTQLLRRHSGIISLPIPFTKFRITLTREEEPRPPILPQEGGDGGP